MVLHVAGTLFGGLKKTLLPGEHVGAGHAVNHAGDGVGLLTVGVALALACQKQGCAIIVIVDVPVRELSAEEEIANFARLTNPPVFLLKAVFRHGLAREVNALGLKDVIILCGAVRVEHAIDKEHLSGLEQIANHSGAIGVRLAQIAQKPRIEIAPQNDGELSAVGGSHGKRLFASVPGHVT